MVPYACWWNALRKSTKRRVLHRAFAILSATNLMYHFPPLFVIATKLAGSGETSALDKTAFLRLMIAPRCARPIGASYHRGCRGRRRRVDLAGNAVRREVFCHPSHVFNRRVFN